MSLNHNMKAQVLESKKDNTNPLPLMREGNPPEFVIFWVGEHI